MVDFLKQSKSLEIVVFTAERFLSSKIDLQGTIFEDFLKQKNLPYVVSPNINNDQRVDEFIDECTLGLSISAPWIIKQSFIDKFEKGKLINIHSAKLPEYRGGGGSTWKILNGEKKGGFTIHFITTGIDDGDIVYAQEYEYPEDCIYPEQRDKIDLEKCKKGLTHLFDKIEKNESFSIESQHEEISGYFPRLNTEKNAFLNWDWKIDDIVSFVRAFSYPYEGSKTYCNGRLYKLKMVKVGRKSYFHPFLNGLVIRKNESELVVAHTEGEIIINGIADVDGNEALSKIRLGDRFQTEKSKIEEAMNFRAIYTAKGLKN